MAQTLPQTHSALNKTINGLEYSEKLGKCVKTTYTFTDLEKQVMDLFPIEWYVDDLEASDFGLDDPSCWLLDWDEVQPLIKTLNITQNQLKGVIGSLANKGAIEIETRGETKAEKKMFGEDLYWLSSRCFESLIAEVN
tara:strand:+ start:101 stop:514 length:414 start_codon:yes stop_codon:yes gene_type:complete